MWARTKKCCLCSACTKMQESEGGQWPQIISKVQKKSFTDCRLGQTALFVTKYARRTKESWLSWGRQATRSTE